MTRLVDALRWSAPALHLQALLGRRRRARRQQGAGCEVGEGHCAVCGRDARFFPTGDNPRESPVCVGCGSVPRQRALVATLPALGIDLASAAVHEASPSLGTWTCFRRRGASFTASMWLPGVRRGGRVGVFHHADLQDQPFADRAFDLVVTQDVLEHVPDAFAALREVQRTLRPGGAHVFTVPRRTDQPTQARAVWRDGEVQHLLPPEYHRDPSTRAGTLVVTDWGDDLERLVAERCGIACTAHRVQDAKAGIPTAIEVFVARQPMRTPPADA